MSRNDAGVLVSAVAANFGQFGARVAISPFVLDIAGAFDTSKAVVGLVLTGMWASYACLQFPSGVLADRYGERRVVLVALAVTLVGGLAVAVAPGLALFALAALGLGVGAGMYFPTGTALLDRRFTETGQVLSVHAAGGPLAGLAVPVAATAVAATHGWRAGVAVGAVVAGLALALVAATVGETPPASPTARVADRLRPSAIRELLTRPGVAFLTAVGFVGMYVFQSFVSFFPTFLQEYHDLSVGRASLAAGVAFVLIAVSMPLVGRFADRYGHDYGLVGPFLVTAGGFSLLLVAGSGPGIAAGVGLVGLGLTWGGAFQSRFMLEFADDERATGFGLARTTFVLLGSAGNVVTGTLASVAGWPAAIGVVVALLVLAAGLVAGNRLLGLGL